MKALLAIFQKVTNRHQSDGLTQFDFMDLHGNIYTCIADSQDVTDDFEPGQGLILDGRWEMSKGKWAFVAEDVSTIRYSRFISLRHFEAFKRRFVWPILGHGKVRPRGRRRS